MIVSGLAFQTMTKSAGQEYIREFFKQRGVFKNLYVTEKIISDGDRNCNAAV